MNQFFKRYRCFVFLFLTVLFFQSCKTDEFKFNEIKIKEDFEIKIITPLFSGKDKEGNILEFRDFIHDWKKPFIDTPGPYTVLRYSNNSYKTIPTRLIFDPSVIIDSLQFLIQGRYNLKEIELVFIVTNSCPFPLNLQLQFINQSNPNKLGPPVLPSAFSEADFTQMPEKPLTSFQSVKLDSLQILSFMNADRVKFTSWFDTNNFINQNDTISAHYPIDVTIVITGLVQGER
jgi:hypothetical protein